MPEKPRYAISLVCSAIISKEREGEIELDIHIYVVNRRLRSGNSIQGSNTELLRTITFFLLE